MKHRSIRRNALRLTHPFVATLCAIACAMAIVVSLWPSPGYIRTEDRRGSGRTDVRRRYDPRGQLSEVDIDTNLDGRWDVQEYYQAGKLVRRESDRNFDDCVDIVEEFDPATGERVRSIVDVDFDGVADLLVLFQGGHGVFSQWAHLPTRPFRGDARAPVSGVSPSRFTP